MKTFKAFGRYFKPWVLAAQGFLSAAIVYLASNPTSLDPVGIPDRYRPMVALFLTFAATQLNSSHKDRREPDTVGAPEIGNRAEDKLP